MLGEDLDPRTRLNSGLSDQRTSGDQEREGNASGGKQLNSTQLSYQVGRQYSRDVPSIQARSACSFDVTGHQEQTFQVRKIPT